ncbi:hypothetical protein [Streptomyces sp. A012304]|uniref:CysS/YqeB C-terminal domain-containing protein n=1 Tax=Streptomyces sp. A012304 TaxID=375446 RepID=UPI0022311D2A|nr:hypothetical protein [Streptomyces sp. A012304]GKQ34590.1 hypothetical protein ALMP_11390 [Streptomyces sp. A012304]
MPDKEQATNVRTGEDVVTEVPTADEAYVQALLREREGYVRHDRADRAAAVDAELKRLGVAVSDGQETAVESKPRRTARGK